MPDPTPPPPAAVTMRDPATGIAHDIPAEQVDTYRAIGFTPETPEQRGGRLAEDVRQQTYGGAAGQANALILAGLRGATLGGSDVLARAIGGDGLAEDIRGLQEVNPITSFAGELGGAILSGGTELPAGLASRAGHAVTSLGEGAGAVGRIGAASLGGAAEGSIYGLGSGVSQLALSDDPLTAEHVASTLSSNMLYGAGLGAGAGALTKAAEIGIGKGKAALDDYLAKSKPVSTADAASAGTEGSTVELSQLDARGLKTARDAEVESLRAAQGPERQAFVDELQAARKQAQDDKTWIATKDAPTREVREIGALTFDADQRIYNLLKNPIELAEKPEKALSALRQQEHALTKLQTWGEQAVRDFVDEFAQAPAKIRAELAAKKIDGYVWDALNATGKENAVNNIMLERYGRTVLDARIPLSQQLPTNLRVLDAVPAQLARNKALQDELVRLGAEPTSQRLDAIDAARDALGGPKAHGVGSGVLHAAAALSGPVGAVAATASHVVGGFKKATGAVAKKAASAASTFLGAAQKGIVKAEPLAPVLATKVLAATRYGDDRRKDEPQDLPSLYKARTDEIQRQVIVAPDGAFQMHPDARRKMSDKLAPVRAVNPVVADQLETLGARRIAWLATQIPRRPDVFASPIGGPDRWQPSDIEMRTFARKVAAAENPAAALERFAHGVGTPEDAQALHAVYPGMVANYLAQVTEGMAGMSAPLPYKQRLGLSILSGKPVDPAMHPEVLQVLQGSFTSDNGKPATSAPTAQPQFGSVKKSVPQPTPGQRVSQGALG